MAEITCTMTVQVGNSHTVSIHSFSCNQQAKETFLACSSEIQTLNHLWSDLTRLQAMLLYAISQLVAILKSHFSSMALSKRSSKPTSKALEHLTFLLSGLLDGINQVIPMTAKKKLIIWLKNIRNKISHWTQFG